MLTGFRSLLLIAASLVVSATASATATMPPTRYISYLGRRVAIYESKGKAGPGILVVHGNTSSAHSYAKILNTDFAKKNRIVAMDLPGFGNSDNYPTYDGATMSGAIVTVAADMLLTKGVIVGWSLGGDLVLQASTQLPKAKGFMIFGTAPVGVTPTLPPAFLSPTESYAGQAVNFGFVPNLTPDMVHLYVTAFFRPGFSSIPDFFYTDGLRADPGTRAAVYAAATGQDPTFQDEVVIVKNLHKPIAILLADHDAFVNPAYLQALAPQIPTLWKNKIVAVANSGHASQWEHPARFTTLLQNFVNSL